MCVDEFGIGEWCISDVFFVVVDRLEGVLEVGSVGFKYFCFVINIKFFFDRFEVDFFK